MKRTIKYIQLLIILVIINACTNDFAEINTDPNEISERKFNPTE